MTLKLTMEEHKMFTEEVKAHFKNVKTVKEWNEKRQELMDDWTVRYPEEVTIDLDGTTFNINKWVNLISIFVDGGGLIVKMLGKENYAPKA